ncbi:MAG: hypothetical protein A2V81_03265 [Candidatus Abawacabacteria bacterium RBG_16_42_10]|uniref:Uncharacterized protein n=1 Tax=Candidatus Abawacabacteria bacterium RBG_16_42_10 TaxID=1817814 RepID=A0A1F4XK98_9BACT|nr:MAG: hypothetical protein A2V81_03265 [Candidatus Abawacabacteria bacterium RBG_16_42_10]
MKHRASLGKKDNVSFFHHITKDTLSHVEYLNRRGKDPTKTFEDIVRNIIVRHAKKDPDFFLHRFREPEDIDLCSQAISLYIEELILRYIFEDFGNSRYGHLEDLDKFQDHALDTLELFSRNVPVDIDHFLMQARCVANYSIAMMEVSTRKKHELQQKKRTSQFIQRSNDYYLINTLLSPNIAQFAERILLRKRLQAILSFQLEQRSWEKFDDNVFSSKDEIIIRESLPPRSLLPH